MIPKDRIKKILILKLCCQGDVIHLTPVIDSLKHNFPNAGIDFITSSWTAPIVNQFKNIDSVKEVDYDLNKNSLFQLKLFYRLYKTVKRGNYDLVFLAHRNNIYGLLLKLAGVKYRIGFKGTVFINLPAEFDKNLHEILRYINVLKSTGLEITSSLPHIDLPKNHAELKLKYNRENKKVVMGIFPFGGVNPGTDMRIKRWELGKYFSLCQKICDTYKDLQLIIFEGRLADEKIESKPDIPGIVITDDFNAISVCSVFMTNDTGALHIAAAYGIPTLAIFGPSDPVILAPLNEPGAQKHRYIWKKPPCSPCWNPATSFNRKDKKHWRGSEFICHTETHECIKDISVDEVYSVFKETVTKIKSV